ncbi:MAG: HAMP domain-containing sensor histidine kinase [Cyanobacteriota bacterium]
MKLNLRETLLITLLLVALLPTIALSTLNLWGLANDETLDKKRDLNNALKSIYTHYKYDLNNLKTSLENLNLVWNRLGYDIHTTKYSELRKVISALKKTANLDIFTITDLKGNVIVRANSNHYGDKINIPNLKEILRDKKTIFSTELLTDTIINNEGKELSAKTNLYTILLETPGKIKELDSNKGLFLIGASPIYSLEEKNKIEGIFFVGKLLSKDYFNLKQETQGLTNVHVDLQPYNVPIEPADNIIFKTIHNYKNKPIANLVVWYDPTQFKQILNETQKTSLYICIIASLSVLFASFIISKYLSKPLKILDEATKEISNDNFDIKVDVHGPTEIEHLSIAFNRMTGELADKRRMQENFTATLTHDMRVPLLAEQKALDLIINDDRFEMSEDQKIIMENMASSNKDLLKLVNTLLDTYKLEAGKYRLDLYEHNIVEIINNTVSEIRPLADDRLQKLVFKTDIDSMTFNFDKDEIKRVLRNLISNAIKFTQKEGEIIVSLCSNDENVLLSVSDNGRGMSETEKEKLFERYSSGAKKLRKVGTGLGLYLSYQIIQAHDGKMWVDTELNKGSTFHISLPKK